jgi:hypothetical protein
MSKPISVCLFVPHKTKEILIQFGWFVVLIIWMDTREGSVAIFYVFIKNRKSLMVQSSSTEL